MMPPLLLKLTQWPTLNTEEKTQRARTFYRVTWVTLLVIALFLCALIVAQPETLLRRGANVVFVLASGFVFLVFNRRGQTTLASWLFVLALGGLVSARAHSSGGISSPVIALFFYVSMIGITARAPSASGFIQTSCGPRPRSADRLRIASRCTLSG